MILPHEGGPIWVPRGLCCHLGCSAAPVQSWYLQVVSLTEPLPDCLYPNSPFLLLSTTACCFFHAVSFSPNIYLPPPLCHGSNQVAWGCRGGEGPAHMEVLIYDELKLNFVYYMRLFSM